MKVSVYRAEDGTMAVLVQASPGKGRVPVLLPEMERGQVRARVGPVIQAMRAPKAVRPGRE